MQKAAPQDETVIIKKYANRRLYDTETSAYITLEDLCARVKDGKIFVVQDAKSGADLTNQVLTQIILEQEIKGFHLLPTSFLRSAIRFYDDKMVSALQPYLDASMNSFVGNRERVQQMMGKAMGEFSPISQFEEISRKNVAMFEKTMQMFNPFGNMMNAKQDEEEEAVAPKAKRAKRG